MYELKLDRWYDLSLKDDKDQAVIGRSFKYENYELKSVDYNIKLEKEEYLRHEPMEISLTAKDENNLPLPDARVDLTLSVESVEKFEQSLQFPSTLWEKTVKIDPSGESKVVIPDSVLPPATVSLRLSARFNNSENQGKSESILLNRKFTFDQILFTQKRDTLCIDYNRKGKSLAGMNAILKRGFLPDTVVVLPTNIRINPLIETYSVVCGESKDSFSPVSGAEKLLCNISQTKDSLFVSIYNPLNLPLSYTLYKNNREIKRGTGSKIEIKQKASRRATHFLSLQYVWGGRVQTKEFYARYSPKKMNVAAILPPVVYPGQKVEVKLAVSDAKGKPMPNVDLTALGYTSKFKDDLSLFLPYGEKGNVSRKTHNSFSKSWKEFETDFSTNLNYPKWKNKMRLDTIEMYRFAYPHQGYYQTTMPTKNSIPQIAPYLVHEGLILPVYMLYIDDKLVYSNEVTTERAYWFPILPGDHTIKMRTTGKLIVFKIRTNPLTDYIVSIDPEIYANDKIYPKPKNYSFDEQKELTRSLIPIRNGHNTDFSYLQQGDDHFELLRGQGYSNLLIAGPFENRGITYTNMNYFDRNFVPDDESFEYEFLYGVTKMRSISPFKWPTYRLPSLDFQQTILSQKRIDSLYQRFLIQKLHVSVCREPIKRKDNSYRSTLQIDVSIPDSIIQKALGWSLYNVGSGIKGFFEPTYHRFENLPVGNYQLFLLLDDFSYYEIPSIEIKENHYKLLKIDLKEFHFSKESLSVRYPNAMPIIQSGYNVLPFLENKPTYLTDLEITKNAKKNNNEKTVVFNSKYKGEIEVTGTVVDENRAALTGASVLVVGTTTSTVTDIDGKYRIKVPAGYRLICFSYIGFENQHLLQENSGLLNVAMKESRCALNEVVVIGYGVVKKKSVTGAVTSISPFLQGRVAGVSVEDNIMIRGLNSISGVTPLYVIDGVISTGISQLKPNDILKMDVLKDASATAIYGTQGANGVVIITTKKGASTTTTDAKKMIAQLLGNDEFRATSESRGGMRSHFSDEAFWQPALTTDKNGVASFETTFPDDITKWDTWFIGLLPGKAAAMTSAQVRSFMPVVGQLSLPRFIVRGDKANVIGKTINYTGDSIRVESSFSINNKIVKTNKAKILNVLIDTVQLTARAKDSVMVDYRMTQENGFGDGESRTIPIIEQGTVETLGEFYALDKDTTISLSAHANADSTILYAESDALELLKNEIRYLRNYRHLCNEQSASQLKALLLEMKIYKSQGKIYPYEKQIKFLIDRLEKSRNTTGYWGWFANQQTEMWISAHVAEALCEARNAGYKVSGDFSILTKDMIWMFDKQNSSEQIRMLRLLHLINPQNNYEEQLNKIHPNPKSLSEKLGYLELKMRYRTISPDTIFRTKETDLFGNCYWVDKKDNLMENNTVATLSVYRILRNIGKYPDLLIKIRNFLFAQRNGGCWRNTYESANILETILPDLLNKEGRIEKSHIALSGALTMSVDSFPLRLKLPQTGRVTVQKTGSYPVYLTTYSRLFNSAPVAANKGFEVKSYWENNASRLEAGKPVKLLVDVTVKESEEFVLVEIPIPAGCSYNDKRQYSRECHREYFTEKVCIYLRRLAKGKSTFEVSLEPRFTGVYQVNPAKAEKMYFPAFYGRTGMKQLEIK